MSSKQNRAQDHVSNFIEYLKPKKNPRDAKEPAERARLFWQWAKDKVIEQLKNKRRKARMNVLKLDGEDLVE